MERLKQLRIEKGLSQAELGKLLSISASTIGMYEQGRRKPDSTTIVMISKFFDVSVDYLFENADIRKTFDPEQASKIIADDIINQPALLFNEDCYTPEELEDLKKIIEKTVLKTLAKTIMT